MAEDEEQSELAKAATLALAEFLANNPGVEIDTVDVKGEERVIIIDPWQDQSVAFALPADYANVAEILNRLYLPPRYSALYHRAERKLEVIWTAYKLDEDQSEVASREFNFEFEGRTHKCGFARSSDDLIEIAKTLAVRMVSSTEFRNLRSFGSYGHRNDDEPDEFGSFGDPISFWIDNLDWDDDAVLNLVRHINFYLRYYDAQSPFVVVHPRKSEVSINPRTRYFEGFGFPRSITSRHLDPSLLVLWGASFGTVRSANFLNFYRIIEYVSFYYMHSESFKQIRNIVKTPHVLADLDRATRDILLVLRTIKYQKEQDAIVQLIKEIVSPNLLWPEISQNKEFFTKPTEFEGDLTIEPLISEKTSLESFGKAGVEKFASSITKIRNALAHGKDISSHKTILPTAYNFDLLQPWLHLIAITAGEVVLFDTTH